MSQSHDSHLIFQISLGNFYCACLTPLILNLEFWKCVFCKKNKKNMQILFLLMKPITQQWRVNWLTVNMLLGFSTKDSLNPTLWHSVMQWYLWQSDYYICDHNHMHPIMSRSCVLQRFLVSYFPLTQSLLNEIYESDRLFNNVHTLKKSISHLLLRQNKPQGYLKITFLS